VGLKVPGPERYYLSESTNPGWSSIIGAAAAEGKKEVTPER
jgi:hypothetical protein